MGDVSIWRRVSPRNAISKWFFFVAVNCHGYGNIFMLNSWNFEVTNGVCGCFPWHLHPAGRRCLQCSQVCLVVYNSVTAAYWTIHLRPTCVHGLVLVLASFTRWDTLRQPWGSAATQSQQTELQPCNLLHLFLNPSTVPAMHVRTPFLNTLCVVRTSTVNWPVHGLSSKLPLQALTLLKCHCVIAASKWVSLVAPRWLDDSEKLVPFTMSPLVSACTTPWILQPCV